jgi:signal peptidase I
MKPRNEAGSAVARFLGFTAIGLVLLAILVPVAALTFSVKVSGHSMEPTLSPGDRLLANILDRGSIERFDVVEATLPGTGERVVKRVIGMPGDTIRVTNDGLHPTVLLKPERSDSWQELSSQTWDSQWANRAGQRCCDAQGLVSLKARAVTVPDDHYWLIGDNWGASDDSRVYGFIAADDIGATLNRRIQPFDRFGELDNPVSLAPVSP